MLYIGIAIVSLLGALLLWLYWRQEAARHGVKLPWGGAVVVMLVSFTAVATYIGRGQHPDTADWIRDWQAHREFAQQITKGDPDPEMAEQVPLQVLARVLQRQLHLTPSTEGWYVLSLIYSELDAPRVAVVAAEKAVEKSGGALEPRLLLARSLIEQEQGKLNQDSARLLDEIVAEHPQHDGAWTLLASAAMQSRDYQRALTAWQALQSRHGDGDIRELLETMIQTAGAQLEAQRYFSGLSVQVDAGEGVDAGGTLFVFLRRPGDSGQPLAAVRVLADRFPMQVTVMPEHWLQDMPAPGTPVVAGARYSMSLGRGVEDALESADAAPVTGAGGALSARVRLPDAAAK
jgi:cytochrome c-type biogenesis protein CcmH